MLVAISDTHGSRDHRLTGRTREAVAAADVVVHAGDFTTTDVYGAIERCADDLVAVHGNRDEPALVERLPTVARLEWQGHRIVVTHGHEHTETGLAMLARQENADVVVVGHSHRPEIRSFGDRPLVNPGSYADPRRHQPAHAEFEATDGGLAVVLHRPDGAVLSEVCQ